MQKSKIPRIRLLIGDRVALGPGKATLLDIIDKTGSISAAAREMGMSYRKAWGLIDNINNDFLEPLVIKTTVSSSKILFPLKVPLLRSILQKFETSLIVETRPPAGLQKVTFLV